MPGRDIILRFLVLLPFLGATASAAPGDPRLSGYGEHVVTERVRWPVRRIEKNPGSCDDLRPEELRVSESGLPARVDAFEAERAPVMHVLLVDTSGSMRERLDSVRKAAAEYVSDLPPDELVWIGGFDDDLYMLGRPTSDRERARARLDALELGSYTRLWDGLVQMLGVLESLPGRKALVLLSDGCDSISPRGRAFPDALAAAERSPETTIFSVGIDLPRSCRGFTAGLPSADDPGLKLDRLAHEAGGDAYDIHDVGSIGPVYERIRSALDREATVVYVPPTDAGADRGESAVRRVRVRSLRPGCRLKSARRSSRRIERAVAAEPSAASPGPLRIEPPRPGVVAGRWVTSSGNRWQAELDEVVRDSGALYRPALRDRPPRWRVGPDRAPRRETRRLEIDWPAADVVRELRADPADWFGAWERQDEDPPFAEGRDRLPADWMHAGSFLDVRRSLAEALWTRPDYRRFAEDKLREDWIRATLGMLDDAGVIEPSARSDIERSLRDSAWSPPARSHARYLAAWLGDYDVREAFAIVERARIREAFDRGFDRVEPPSASRWREAFPPPVSIRMIVPTRLVYDAEGDRFGFVRLRLPTPRNDRAPEDGVPSAAWVYDFFADASPPAGLELLASEYVNVPRRARLRLRKRFGGKRGVEDWIAVHLGWRERASTFAAHLFFDTHSKRSPVCVDLLDASSESPDWLGHLPSCAIELPHAGSATGASNEARRADPGWARPCAIVPGSR